MLMKKIKLFFTAMALVLAATTAFAQNLQISGVVTDSTTGEVVEIGRASCRERVSEAV